MNACKDGRDFSRLGAHTDVVFGFREQLWWRSLRYYCRCRVHFRHVPLLRPPFVRTSQNGTGGVDRCNKVSFFGDDNSMVLAGMTQGVCSGAGAKGMFCTISTPCVAKGLTPSIVRGATATDRELLPLDSEYVAKGLTPSIVRGATATDRELTPLDTEYVDETRILARVGTDQTPEKYTRKAERL